jgi:hypothetical protein
MPDLVQAPGRVNVYCKKGDAISFTLWWKDDDVSTWTFDANVDETIAITIASAGTPPTGYTSGITLSLTSGETDTITLGSHNWALDRTDVGSERRWVAGDWESFQYNP